MGPPTRPVSMLTSTGKSYFRSLVWSDTPMRAAPSGPAIDVSVTVLSAVPRL